MKKYAARALIAAGFSFFANVLSVNAAGEDSLLDHQAKVFNVSGTGMILKSGVDSWRLVTEGEPVEEGDQVRTEADSQVEIYFDDFLLNFLRIDANTLAEFRAIEPTDIYLTDGSIFNELEGLPEDSMYTIATPTAVASARGTSFLREYSAAEKTDNTSVVSGKVDMAPLDEKGEARWNEKVEIAQDQNFSCNQTMIRAQGFQNLRPRTLAPEHRMKMEGIKKVCRERLTKFAGGPERMQQARQQWQEIKRDPERMQRVRERIQAKPHPRFQDYRGIQPFGEKRQLDPQNFPSGRQPGAGSGILPQAVGPFRGGQQKVPPVEKKGQPKPSQVQHEESAKPSHPQSQRQERDGKPSTQGSSRRNRQK